MRKLPEMVLLTVCLLPSIGCDTPDHTGGESSAGNTPAGYVINPSPSVDAFEPDATIANTLAPGTFDIRLYGGNVTLLANNAPKADILNELAALTGFELLDYGIPMEPVTLAIDGSDVHTILVELLKPVPYQIIYEFENSRGVDSLTRVVAGRATAVETTPAPLPETSGATVKQGSTPLPDAGQAALSTEDQVYLNLLLDPSPKVRADAAESIKASGIALDYLARIITSDPSPEVRIAATYSLENSEDPRAVDALISGLTDADPEVLVEVIDSLAFLDDRSAIPYLQPLLGHPDEDVRDAAESAIETLH